MHTLANIGSLIAGLLVALAAVSVTRIFGGPWGVIQFPVIILVLALFFLNEDRLIALAAGIGLGLDLVSSYPFLSWTVIVGGTVFIGWWMAGKVLTNRSLPSLMALAAAMRAAYFILELLVSRLSQLVGGTVWYRAGMSNLPNVAAAFAIEMAVLAAFFIIHFRLRGVRSRMLTHI